MKNWLLKAGLLTVLWNIAFSARILVLYVHDERSHLFSMGPFLKRLSQDGHDLTIFDTCHDRSPANLGFNASFIHRYFPTPPEIEAILSEVIWLHDPHSAILGYIHKIGDDAMSHLVLEASDMFVEIFKKEYDLVIVDEIFSIHGMTVAKILREMAGVPYIIFTTSNVGCESNVAEYAMGHTPVIDASHGTLLPSGHDDVYDPTKFYLRLYNVLQAIGEYFVLYVHNPLIATYGGPSKLTVHPFSTHEVNRNAEINLRESLDRLGRIAPIGNDFRGIGSHCKTPIPELPKDLKEFVEDPTSKGTIYIAFGSLVNFDACPQFVFDAFFEALDEFPDYRIIFSMKKLKSREIPKLNDHVKLVNWAPQLAILGHEKTKLFMSHGGLKSYKEALCTKTPVVFLPILAEQGAITRMSMKMGIATALNKYTITGPKIVEAFNRVLQNPSYQQNMNKVYDFYLDRIIPSLDEGAWYVNKIFKRTEKLGKRSAGLPDDEKSLMFFRRKGISLYSFNHFGFDWIVVMGIMSYILSK